MPGGLGLHAIEQRVERSAVVEFASRDVMQGVRIQAV